MRNGTLFLNHGWKPNIGFLPYYWDTYSEHLILQALALGSTTHAVPTEVWDEWERRTDSFNGEEIVYSHSGSLFTYQYAQAFIDFQNLDDGGINYFENSHKATVANQEFCAMNTEEYKSYQNNMWGLSASLGPDGYKAYGARPGVAHHDGTIAPHAVLGSIVFTPEMSTKTIRSMYEKFGDKIYGLYGFKDSFNVDRDWWANEYLGVDQGIAVLMLENFLNDGAVWKRFMRLEPITRWVERTGLTNTSSRNTTF